jgi:hypothetical protein
MSARNSVCSGGSSITMGAISARPAAARSSYLMVRPSAEG